MKELFLQLLRIPSVTSDEYQLHEIVDFVQSQFDGLTCHIDRYEFKGKPSIVISNHGGKWFDILMSGHLDVVPASTSEQFEPIEKDGKIFARGAMDMKDGDAVIITVMKYLLQQGFSDKKIALMLTCDEEVGGFDGVGELTKLGYGADVVLVPDGGDNTTIVHKGKGVLSVELTAHGQSCHGAYPRKGINAIELLLSAYQIIKSELFDIAAYDEPDHRGTTISLNMIQGGEAGNQVPGAAKAKLDCRFTEQYTADSLAEAIQEVLHDCDGVTMSVGSTGACVYLDPTDEVLHRYADIVRETFGYADLDVMHGATDGRWFTNSKVIIHKATGANLHTANEWVERSAVEKLYNVYSKFILSS